MENEQSFAFVPSKRIEKGQLLTNDNYRDRRRLEMKRRIGLLQHKRSCLERELRAINNILHSLNMQVERDAKYEKLHLSKVFFPEDQEKQTLSNKRLEDLSFNKSTGFEPFID